MQLDPGLKKNQVTNACRINRIILIVCIHVLSSLNETLVKVDETNILYLTVRIR